MQDIFKTKHLTFQRLPLRTARITSIWSVWNHSYGEEIGQIRWYSPWRQYCFFGDSLVLSGGCLRDISDMIAKLSAEAIARAMERLKELRDG